jgi:dermatan/chondrotin sulfate uronyl 2-O-sulfotransferase UST
MMAFCGHDLGCSIFNSLEVMQRAKANVEKFYPVVGVLENLNKSLAVMEKLLPNVFKGATQVLALNCHFIKQSSKLNKIKDL